MGPSSLKAYILKCYVLRVQTRVGVLPRVLDTLLPQALGCPTEWQFCRGSKQLLNASKHGHKQCTVHSSLQIFYEKANAFKMFPFPQGYTSRILVRNSLQFVMPEITFNVYGFVLMFNNLRHIANVSKLQFLPSQNRSCFDCNHSARSTAVL